MYAAILGPAIAAIVVALAEIALCMRLGEHKPPPDYNPHTQLAAVAADLRCCAGYLAQIAAAEQQAELTPEEIAVCKWAADFAPRVRLLAVEAQQWVLGAPRPKRSDSL